MKAVMYGAGSIGRGFIAQLFYESGYDTVFIDIDRELIGRIMMYTAYARREKIRCTPVFEIMTQKDKEEAENLLREIGI